MEKQKSIEAVIKQRTINSLIKQNLRLTERLEHYENRPSWWKFSERRKWKEVGR